MVVFTFHLFETLKPLTLLHQSLSFEVFFSHHSLALSHVVFPSQQPFSVYALSLHTLPLNPLHLHSIPLTTHDSLFF
jgi:hypothetical protein